MFKTISFVAFVLLVGGCERSVVEKKSEHIGVDVREFTHWTYKVVVAYPKNYYKHTNENRAYYPVLFVLGKINDLQKIRSGGIEVVDKNGKTQLAFIVWTDYPANKASEDNHFLEGVVGRLFKDYPLTGEYACGDKSKDGRYFAYAPFELSKNYAMSQECYNKRHGKSTGKK